MSIDRDSFEQWQLDQNKDIPGIRHGLLCRFNNGDYAVPEVRRDWKVWQAATEQGVSPVRGDSVSIDVSTNEETAANRVFGVLTGDNNGDRTWLADLDHFNYVVPNEVAEALAYYADPEHYWTETQSYDGKYISNGVTEETYHCSDVGPERAREALKLIESKPPAEQGVGEPVGIIKHRTNPMSDNPGAYVDWQFGGDEINLPHGTEVFLHPPKPTDGDLTIDDYKEALESHRRMVRELDVLINGDEGAAKQASLCDLVGQIESEGLVAPNKPTGGGVPESVVQALKLAEYPCRTHYKQGHDGGYEAYEAVKKAIALLATQQPPEQQASFQARVDPWLIECFGEDIAREKTERNHRFLEEALELVQSTGCTKDEANELVSYVYGRDVGDPPQEVGGVMVTLAALCLANDMDMHDAGEAELARIWTKVPQIRAKQKTKPAMSPLPGVYPDRQPLEQD